MSLQHYGLSMQNISNYAAASFNFFYCATTPSIDSKETEEESTTDRETWLVVAEDTETIASRLHSPKSPPRQLLSEIAVTPLIAARKTPTPNSSPKSRTLCAIPEDEFFAVQSPERTLESLNQRTIPINPSTLEELESTLPLDRYNRVAINIPRKFDLSAISLPITELASRLASFALEGIEISHLTLNAATSSPDDFTAFFERFPAIQSLKIINLQKECRDLVFLQNPQHLTKLVQLSLPANQLALPAAKALMGLTQLIDLDLSDNLLCKKSARFLAHLTQIKRLDLSNNNLCGGGVKALSALTALETLSLGRNNFGDEGALALVPLTNLRELSVPHNRIALEGAIALGRLTQLESVNIASNRICKHAAWGLFKSSGNCNFTTINLSGNLIGEKGVKALKLQTNLQELNLAACALGDKDIQGLDQLSHLRILILCDNPITESVTKDIRSRFARLDTLDLSSNSRCAEKI